MKPKKIIDIIKENARGGLMVITLKSGAEFIYNNAPDDRAVVLDGETLKLTTETKLNKWLTIYIDCDDISAISYETT